MKNFICATVVLATVTTSCLAGVVQNGLGLALQGHYAQAAKYAVPVVPRLPHYPGYANAAYGGGARLAGLGGIGGIPAVGPAAGLGGGVGLGGPGDIGRVFRFVSVHVPPPEAQVPVPAGPRVLNAGGPRDTHYNIIFVKAPAAPVLPPTEVILPEAPQQKTLVYVLVKKPYIPTLEESIRFTQPPPFKPGKPEVYFVTYKGQKGPGGPAVGPAGPGPVGESFAPVPQADVGYSNGPSFGAPQSVPAHEFHDHQGGYAAPGGHEGYQRRADDHVQETVVDLASN